MEYNDTFGLPLLRKFFGSATKYIYIYICMYVYSCSYLNQAVSFSISVFMDRRFEHFKDSKIFRGTFLSQTIQVIMLRI